MLYQKTKNFINNCFKRFYKILKSPQGIGNRGETAIYFCGGGIQSAVERGLRGVALGPWRCGGLATRARGPMRRKRGGRERRGTISRIHPGMPGENPEFSTTGCGVRDERGEDREERRPGVKKQRVNGVAKGNGTHRDRGDIFSADGKIRCVPFAPAAQPD